MKKKLFVLSSLAMGAMPFLALAQGGLTGVNPDACSQFGGTVTTIQGMICKLNDILSALIPFLIALGILYFVWGVITYVISDDEEAKTKGRDRMVYGIIGLVVIIGVWALVRIVRNTFNLGNRETIVLPTVPY